MQLLTELSDTFFGYYLWNKSEYRSMTVSKLEFLMQRHAVKLTDNLISSSVGKETILSYALQAGNDALISYICKKATIEDLNEPCRSNRIIDEYPIHLCLDCKAASNQISRLTALLKKGVNPNQPVLLQNYTTLYAPPTHLVYPIEKAVSSCSALAVALLVEYGAIFKDQIYETQVIQKLWEVYKTAFVSLSGHEGLPRELSKYIQSILASKIVFSKHKIKAD